MKCSNRDVRARVVDGGITYLRIGNRAFYSWPTSRALIAVRIPRPITP